MRSLAVIALLASVAHADDHKYTLADLKTLVGDNAYQEALQHVGDVPPAQRNADWIEVAATAAAGVLATLPADDGSTIVMIDMIDREYPQLMKSAKYTKPRAELGVDGLGGCFRMRDDCMPVALRFAGSDRALALATAKNTVVHDAAGTVTLLKRVMDPKLCREEALQRAVLAGLDRKPDSAIATDARSMMMTCWDVVKESVAKAFDEASKGSDVHKNTCDVLKAKRMLSPLQVKRCK
jgi:hypothetical protein